MRTLCFAVFLEKTNLSQDPGIVNSVLATKCGQLNWIGPIAKSSDRIGYQWIPWPAMREELVEYMLGAEDDDNFFLSDAGDDAAAGLMLGSIDRLYQELLETGNMHPKKAGQQAPCSQREPVDLAFKLERGKADRETECGTDRRKTDRDRFTDGLMNTESERKRAHKQRRRQCLSFGLCSCEGEASFPDMHSVTEPSTREPLQPEVQNWKCGIGALAKVNMAMFHWLGWQWRYQVDSLRSSWATYGLMADSWERIDWDAIQDIPCCEV